MLQMKNGMIVRFNESKSHIILSAPSKNVFSVFKLKPFSIVSTHTVTGYELKFVDMMYTSAVCAIVTKYSKSEDLEKKDRNKVVVYNRDTKKTICEIPEKVEILNIRLNRNLIFVLVNGFVNIYNALGLGKKARQIYEFSTLGNSSNRSIDISLNSGFNYEPLICAFPAIQKGLVRILSLNLRNKDMKKSVFDDADDEDSVEITIKEGSKKEKGKRKIKCKEKFIPKVSVHKLCYMKLNNDGSYLATASERGTLIRIWNTSTHQLIKELRRGSTSATILGISFSDDNKFISVVSTTGTLHMFSISKYAPNDEIEVPDSLDGSDFEGTTSKTPPKNTKSIFPNFMKFGKWLNSEWSFAQKKKINGCSICSFLPKTNNVVNVITEKGELVSVTFENVFSNNLKDRKTHEKKYDFLREFQEDMKKRELKKKLKTSSDESGEEEESSIILSYDESEIENL